MKKYKYILRILIRFSQLRSIERYAFVEAFFSIVMVRLWILLFPFKWIAPKLEISMSESSNTALAHMEADSILIEQSLGRLQRYLPQICTCLAKSIAGKLMLRRRRVPNTLHLGVTIGTSRGMIAHAWLSSGDRTITGAQEMDSYSEVATFSDYFKKYKL